MLQRTCSIGCALLLCLLCTQALRSGAFLQPRAAVAPPSSCAAGTSAGTSSRSALRMSNGNSFGRLFRVTSFGESHGAGVGVVVDGCPPRVPLSVLDVQAQLNRRRPGQSTLTTPRNESDEVEILSGIGSQGVTLGTPIAMLVRNRNQKASDYSDLHVKYRPSHADFSYDAKYGVREVAGGGRASARETIARVAAGAIARKVLRFFSNVDIVAYVKRVQDIEADVDPNDVTADKVEASPIRCPDPAASAKMVERVEKLRLEGDSAGGVIECVVTNVPLGLGAPVFDKLEAELAKACMSLPATKGFEVGSGFAGTLMTGKTHNDEFYIDEHGRTRTRTNRSGGIQGGITNGENIVCRVAFKPTSTISQEQKTVTRDGQETTLSVHGRHDPCVLPRAVPIVEAMVAITILDALIGHHGQCELFPRDFKFEEGSVCYPTHATASPRNT